MARPSTARLVSIDDADLTPVHGLASDSIHISLRAMIQWSASSQERLAAIEATGYPFAEQSHYLTASTLAYRGALRPSALAALVGTSRSNMTKIVNHLEQEGLVARVADPADDRGVLVVLTAQGREIGARAIQFGERRVAGSMDGWTAEERALFQALLSRFVSVPLDAEID